MGRWHFAIATSLALLSAGCGDDGTLVILELRTDFRPGLEFNGIRTALEGRPEVSTFADPASDYLEGVRIAELTDLEPGTHSIRVALIDASGRVVAERPIRVTLADRVAVTVVITRTCRGVSCPTADAPELEACLAGRCVDPSCSPETPDLCVAECETSAECSASSACSVGRCRDAVCLVVPDDEACSGGRICDPDDGCVDPPTPLDSGADTGLPPTDGATDTPLPTDGASDADATVVSDGAPADVSAACEVMSLQTCGTSGCSCDGGCFCSMACQFSTRCRATCSDVGTTCNLMMQSGGTADATLICRSGARCQGILQGSATAAVSCEAGTDCDFTCSSGACDMVCTGGASCLLRCTGGDPCTISSCDGTPVSCPSGVIACNSACP